MSSSIETKLRAIPFDKEIVKLTESFIGRKWVFRKIDHWIKHTDKRFFILTGEPGVGKSAIAARLTQTRKDIAAYHFCITRQISTVEPNNVLLSLAAQLIKYFPDYGEALVNIVKPLFLQVNVEINIENIRDSVVQGVVIENLHIHYPKQALDIVLRQALAALPNPPKEPISILIDSLDEAVTYSNENNLVTLLSSVDDLPSWVRFILTSRPDKQRVLCYFETLKHYHHYHLNELSEENKKDIHDYVDKRVVSEPIQKQIQRFQVQSEALIHQITELSEGNFLYTKVLLDDIKLGGQPLDNLDALPKGLNEFYHNFLLRLKAEWEGKYQPIFGILTVTKAALTEEELTNLLLSKQLDETELAQRLRVVQQFLDVVKNDRAENTYTLFHQSLQDYLVDKEKSGVFYCSPKDGHRKIIDYYWGGYHPRDWQECDRYGLRYLPIHLVDMAALEKPPNKAREYIEKLHKLLETEVDGRNAWFDAKNNITEYLADITLAWQIAEKEFSTSQSSQSIAWQCRYALITSSINSITGNFPTQLIVELLKKGSARGLAYFRQQILTQQLQEPDLRILSTLQPQELQPKLVEKLFGEIEELRDRNYQTLVKSALVQLSRHLLPHVLEEAKALENEKVRVQALSLLIPHLSPKQCSELLEIAGLIKQNQDKKNLLTLLAPSVLDEMLPKVLKMSRELKGQYRADVLIALAPRLVIELLPEALEVALEILSSNEYEYALTRALSGLAAAPGLTEDLIEKIQQQAEAFQNKNDTTHVMSALIPHLSLEQQDKILQQIQVMNDECDKAQILSALASRLPLNQQAKILDIVYAIDNEYYKAKVLSVLVRRLPSDQLHNILQEVQTISEEHNKASVLIGLCTASGLTIELIEKIKEQAELFKNKNNKALIFSNLSRHLCGETVDKLVLKLETIDDNYNRTKTIISLLSYLDLPISQLHNIFQEVQRIHAQSDKATALSQLATAPNLSVDLAEKIQEEANLFQNKNHRVQVLSKLAKYLSEQLLQEVLETTKAIENWKERAEALSALALSLPPNQLHHELRDLLAIGDKYERAKAEILETLAVHLPLEKLHYVTQEFKSIDKRYQADVLSILACRLPSDQLQNIIQELEAIDDNKYKVRVLSELAPRLLSDRLHDQLHKNYKNQVLEALKPDFGSDQPYKIVQNLQTIKREDENYKALVLKALLPLCSPEELQEILKVARAIENEFYRADILRVLAPQLVKLSRDNLHCLWNETLHILASRRRRQLLSDFRELTPVIFSLGKDEAVVKVCDAIKDIGKQWP